MEWLISILRKFLAVFTKVLEIEKPHIINFLVLRNIYSDVYQAYQIATDRPIKALHITMLYMGFLIGCAWIDVFQINRF